MLMNSKDLAKMIKFVQWVVNNHDDPNEFYAAHLRNLQRFHRIVYTMGTVTGQDKQIDIPYQYLADFCSIHSEHYNEYAFMEL